jgi:hypothetical protein
MKKLPEQHRFTILESLEFLKEKNKTTTLPQLYEWIISDIIEVEAFAQSVGGKWVTIEAFAVEEALYSSDGRVKDSVFWQKEGDKQEVLTLDRLYIVREQLLNVIYENCNVKEEYLKITDYRNIKINDKIISFTPNQATVIECLHKEHLKGKKELSQSSLMELLEKDSFRMDKNFRSKPAPQEWREFVLKQPNGNWRLNILK